MYVQSGICVQFGMPENGHNVDDLEVLGQERLELVWAGISKESAKPESFGQKRSQLRQLVIGTTVPSCWRKRAVWLKRGPLNAHRAKQDETECNSAAVADDQLIGLRNV